MLRTVLFMVLLFLDSLWLVSKLTRGPSTLAAAALVAGALASRKHLKDRARPLAFAGVAGAIAGCFASWAHGAVEDQEALVAAADRRQAAREHEARLASVPRFLQRADEAIASGDWPAADVLLRSVHQIQPDHPGIRRRERIVGAELEALRAREREGTRVQAIEEGVALARRVVASRTLCETAKAVGEAWDKLRKVRPNDGEFGMATKLAGELEACRRLVARQLSQQLATLAARQRRRFAQELESRSTASGIDIDVSIAGDSSDEIIVKWVLANRTTFARLDPDGRLAESLERAGFRRITFTNGFGMTTSKALAGPGVRSAEPALMNSLGLGEPLALLAAAHNRAHSPKAKARRPSQLPGEPRRN